MAPTMSNAAASDPVRSSEFPRAKPAKAGLPSDAIGLSVIAVTVEGVLSHYGSIKAAALSLSEPGKPFLDPSQMMREFKAGNFRLLERADDIAKAAIFAYAHEAFGPLSSPAARGRFLFQELRRIQNEIEQLFGHVMEQAG